VTMQTGRARLPVVQQSSGCAENPQAHRQWTSDPFDSDDQTFQSPMDHVSGVAIRQNGLREKLLFRYMREHYSLDRPDRVWKPSPFLMPFSVVNSGLGAGLDSQNPFQGPAQRHRLAAQFGAVALSQAPTVSQIPAVLSSARDTCQEEIQVLDLEIGNLKQLRKEKPSITFQ